MTMRDLSTITPREVQFLELIHETAKSLIYLVVARGLKCVMKIHRGQERSNSDEDEDKINKPSRFTRERLVYERLDARGLTKRGIVPMYYGYRRKLEPALWHPYLQRFAADKIPPDALFLEHIPNISKFWTAEEYSVLIEDLRKIVTPSRVQRLRKMFSEIQDVGVLHGDFELRNLTICDDDDRVLWMDFDSGRIRPDDDSVPASVAPWVPDKKKYWDRAFERERADVNVLFRDIDDAVRTGNSFSLWKYSEE